MNTTSALTSVKDCTDLQNYHTLFEETKGCYEEYGNQYKMIKEEE
jgi:hypothetical protein